jgi:hypothetical protein
MKKAVAEQGDGARAAFARIGVLMASARRSSKALHPTNLHVNRELFPNDTVQSRLPDPGWLEHWLDRQIQFDDGWEERVSSRILHNLSLLFEEEFGSVQDLNRYRKTFAARGGDDAASISDACRSKNAPADSRAKVSGTQASPLRAVASQ